MRPENGVPYRLRQVALFKCLHDCILFILILSIYIQFRVVPQVLIDLFSLLPGPFLFGTQYKQNIKNVAFPVAFPGE